jgi:hypothetical protein
LQTSSSLDDLMEVWEKQLKALGAGAPAPEVFLELAVYDLGNAAKYIDCPFCRRHMLLESEEVARVLLTVRSLGNRPHSHGIGERLGAVLTSLEIVANVLLGGLRRAGII